MSDERMTRPRMPGEATPPLQSVAWLAEFEAMSVEELKRVLLDSLGLSVRHLYRAACALHTLLEKGVPLSELKGIGLVYRLQKIAEGSLLPELVVQFHGKPSFLNAASSLPVSVQQRIVDGEPIPVVVSDGSGRTVRMRKPIEIMESVQTIRQLFARDHIRDEAGQHGYLDDRNTKAARPVTESVGCMKIDRELKCVLVGRQRISLADLRVAVKALERS